MNDTDHRAPFQSPREGGASSICTCHEIRGDDAASDVFQSPGVRRDIGYEGSVCIARNGVDRD